MKITIVAPFESISCIVKDILAKEDFGFPGEVEVVPGDLEAGLEQAYLARERGTDVFISRGGTAALIAKNIDIPVVEIPVTAFDVLRAIKQAGHVSGAIGVVFTRRLLFECQMLGDLIGIPIEEIFMEQEPAGKEKILAAHQRGITTFLGDATTVKMLNQLGFHHTLIESAQDAIAKALTEACKLAAVRRKEQEKTEVFRTIIDLSTEGILAIDKAGRVSVCNTVAQRIFRLNGLNAIGKYIDDIRPDDQLRDCLKSDEYEKEGIQIIGDRSFAVKRVAIKLGNEVVGAIANIQDVTQLQHFEQVIRQKLNKKGLTAKFSLENLIGSSLAMTVVKERMRQYANAENTVLITGESGTGKELIAQSIHNLSHRKNGPFVAVNCAAFPESLLESELFGYKEGAFTGAKKGGKAGLFELAHGGTILLDEISEMPLALQARLLRVLQEREVMRLGADSIIPINVRVLAATNRDLLALVDQNRFRADLYYRLDVLRLTVPPLRERIEDIPDLIEHFFDKTSPSRSNLIRFSENAIKLLQEQYWRGNVRELENVIERLKLLNRGAIIEASDLQQEFIRCEHAKPKRQTKPIEVDTERQTVERILLEEKFNYTQAAKKLGISRTTLWRKLREWKV